jgi:subtilisin family serine protease
MPDVWIGYITLAEKIARARIRGERMDKSVALDSPARAQSDGSLDLLLTPWTGASAGSLAKSVRQALGDPAEASKKPDGDTKADPAAPAARPKSDPTAAKKPYWNARVAHNAGRVVVHLDLVSLVRFILPLTDWWQNLFRDANEFEDFNTQLAKSIDANLPLRTTLSNLGQKIEFFRFATLVGFADLLMNAKSPRDLRELAQLARQLGGASEEDDGNTGTAGVADSGDILTRQLAFLLEGFEHAIDGDATSFLSATAVNSSPQAKSARIYLINLNRGASQTLFDSRKTVKADAGCQLFNIDTNGLAFAVIDGGVDARHEAFRDLRASADITEAPLRSRVKATYDFTMVRDIINVANAEDPAAATPIHLPRIQKLWDAREKIDAVKTGFEHLKIRNDAARDLDWTIAEPLIRIPHDAAQSPDDPMGYKPPGTDHGTHVAGILASNWEHPSDGPIGVPLVGMCPDLSLYDLRVFDTDGHGDEFAILCALEFVGWINRDRGHPVIHGANLSLALVHDVDSFACGQTPICEACNHLVGLGTVVVAAAGNTGFEAAANKQSLGNGYRQISITDPGNAGAVITVGSTHRRDPHLYGVSYFSGRGPTGDGRRKPDLLAPGEKITSTIRENGMQRMDGTSMAAPHVSGAAALLMARYPELIGRPLRIKEILMETATDLKRDHDFQGAGLLDVLRALQSV